MSYEWLKALHLIAVISWLAGLLYLPRLFVYHADIAVGSEASAMLQRMERRLLRFITTPAMVASLLLGLGLLHANPALLASPSIWTKGGLLLLLFGFHGWCAAEVRAFSLDRRRHSARFYRVANEVPTLLMIGIVILIVIRPFL